MSRHDDVKGTMQDRFNELKTLRDEIRLDLHLGSMNLRDEWKKLEKKLPHPAAATELAAAASSEALTILTDELRKFRDRLHSGSKQRIARIMSRPPVACAPWDSLSQALTTMLNSDLGCLPVTDTDGRALGMLTDRDAAIAACTRGGRMDDIRVDSAMSKRLISCLAGDDLRKALGLMRAHKIRRLPVLDDDGLLIGIVTLNDFINSLNEGAELERPTAEASEVVNTLAAIAASSRIGGVLSPLN